MTHTCILFLLTKIKYPFAYIIRLLLVNTNGHADTKIASTFGHNFLYYINILSFRLINSYSIMLEENPKVEV